MSKPYVFYISGMSCASCSNGIEAYLKATKIPEIDSFHVDFSTQDPKKTTIILKNPEIDPAKENHQRIWNDIKGHIEDIGYKCETYNYSPNNKHNAQEKTTTPELEQNTNPKKESSNTLFDLGKKILASHWFLGASGCISGIALLVLSLTMGGLPLLAMLPLAGLSIVLTLLLGARSYSEAWKKFVTTQTLTMDTLFAISTISVIVVSLTSFFIPWLPMMFEAGLLIYGFRHIGIAIEETIKEKISSAQFQDRAPKQVRLSLPDGTQDMDLHQIKKDDFIVLFPGEIIPMDGLCENESIIYTTIITGAILPRHFRAGEKVLAGMRLADEVPSLKIRVLRPAKQSYLARLDEGIEQSINEKAPLEIKTGKLLAYFIPAVITLAITSGIIIGIFFPAAIAIQCAISVLVSACPCTLGLIIPLAVKTGIHKAAEHGVHFKNSKILQEAEQIDTIVFDLNGTLTTGVPIVKRYSVINNANISPDDFLALCSALEESSTHPVGKSIHAYCNKNSSRTFSVTKPNDSHHSGIFGCINGKDYTIGSPSLMNEIGISTTSIEANLELEAGDSLVFMAEEKNLIGYIIITDPLRKDAFKTIKTLTDMGKVVHLCTGADEKTALRYAKALGITNIHANAVATDLENGDKSKPAYIKGLQLKGHKVAMVGDAANDARAIAASDLGIAVLSQDSDELTQQHAGAVIQNGTLLPIISTFAVSQQTVSNIKENLLFSLGYNIAAVLVAGGLLVAVGITLNPAVGVALMAIQASLILLNVYRFKEQPVKQLQETQQPQEVFGSSHQVIKKHSPVHQITASNEYFETLNSTEANSPPLNSGYLWKIVSAPQSEANKVQQNTEDRSGLECNI
ncbi:heavy metal translocating P-type ATPase [Legionella quateirensis]|uniref:Cation transporting ATPase PacS n=1 Tax=Legionella quateirensis TaxID=45072 RepID=A0A378L011_9GAMM|nr:HAD-IC family P-type ATPase [Legionella quateirensis]KTD52762.1 cation transporting ATPase PacS [Legionella quateirensis]STY19181.1 cation transporting ATPase PacS [Legionella quateirensis]